MNIQPKQTIQQRLMLAPNVMLALEVLRMPTLELHAFLERQLEENPCLEVEAPSTGTTASSDASSSDGEAASPPQPEDPWASGWRTAGEWEDPDEDERLSNRRAESGSTVAPSLHESLRIQLGCQSLSQEELRLGELLIHHLNDAGYLDEPMDTLASDAGVGIEPLTAALRLVQRLDPPGVGARDLCECLMLQLEQAGRTDSLAYRILAEHFPLFAKHRMSAIERATGSSPAEVADACEELRGLNPKPGAVFIGDLPPSVIPDLVIHHRERYYDAELNDQEMPRVTVNRAYYRMLRDPNTPSDAKEFLEGKFRKANWLIKAIDERNATLLSIARCLISLQREFLDHGQRALKPLTQAQVAGLIGRHPSTVSRAIAGKTIDTPYGIFRLEQLFATNVPQVTPTSESVSDERVKAEIQRFITEEDPRKPLSDAALAHRLADRGISVARRTIAKYRLTLKILPTHLRKRRF